MIQLSVHLNLRVFCVALFAGATKWLRSFALDGRFFRVCLVFLFSDVMHNSVEYSGNMWLLGENKQILRDVIGVGCRM